MNKQKKNIVKKKSPNIFRSIAESFKKTKLKTIIKPQKIVLSGFVSIILVLSIILVVIDIKNLLKKQEIMDLGRNKILEQVEYWKGVVEKRSDYRDGYFQLSVLSYQIGKKIDAVTYVQKALEIDPNFEEGRKLEKTLNEK